MIVEEWIEVNLDYCVKDCISLYQIIEQFKTNMRIINLILNTYVYLCSKLPFNTIRLTRFFIREGQLYLSFDHLNSKDEPNRLSECLSELWYKISGFNTFSLKYLVAIWYNWSIYDQYIDPFFNEKKKIDINNTYFTKISVFYQFRFLDRK